MAIGKKASKTVQVVIFETFKVIFSKDYQRHITEAEDRFNMVKRRAKTSELVHESWC